MYSKKETQDFLRNRVARPASAGVVVCNAKGEALVLKANYKAYWSFPGGWIEDNQTPMEAALRELQEETGITLSSEDIRFFFMVNRSSELMQSYQFIFLAMNALPDKEELQLQPDEIDTYKFVSRQTVRQNLHEFGGAVQVWATGQEAGYYEQTISLDSVNEPASKSSDGNNRSS